MPRIAGGAQVSGGARLAADVVVGPGAVIEEDCEIGGGSEIGAYSIIWRGARIGERNRIFPFCSLGGEPQDKKFRGEESRLIIGDDNTIREYCFFNRGTSGGGFETRVGNGNWIMGYVHLAHDCIVGDGTTIANGAQFAGHAEVGGGAVIGGGALFHQFRRVGALAMVGGGERVRQDIPPFALAARGVVGVNGEGMRRAGFDGDAVGGIKEAFRVLYSAGLPLAAARETVAEMAAAAKNGRGESLRTLADFLALDNLELIRPAR
ncbi:MAG: acyl-ACP--UDP-N-acetylglucosamine O-acyltransferase [Gammaproteobacteria bacterium]